MTGYLLDTNVVSEHAKRRPNPAVLRWLERESDTWLSVLTVGELRRGVYLLRARDARRAEDLDAWIDQLTGLYHDRILLVDGPVVDAWARLPVARTLPVVDGLIAGTAQAHGLTVATRNVADFGDTGVAVFDPFTP